MCWTNSVFRFSRLESIETICFLTVWLPLTWRTFKKMWPTKYFVLPIENRILQIASMDFLFLDRVLSRSNRRTIYSMKPKKEIAELNFLLAAKHDDRWEQISRLQFPTKIWLIWIVAECTIARENASPLTYLRLEHSYIVAVLCVDRQCIQIKTVHARFATLYELWHNVHRNQMLEKYE